MTTALTKKTERDAIMKIAQTIKKSSVKNKEEHFKQKYINFSNKYPLLYKMCCEDNFDINRLEYMLNMIDSVQNKTKTYEEASKEVGQTMFDVYVDPLVKRQEAMNKAEQQQ